MAEDCKICSCEETPNGSEFPKLPECLDPFCGLQKKSNFEIMKLICKVGKKSYIKSGLFSCYSTHLKNKTSISSNTVSHCLSFLYKHGFILRYRKSINIKRGGSAFLYVVTEKGVDWYKRNVEKKRGAK